MSGIENIDVMLLDFHRNRYGNQRADSEIEVDLESEGLYRNTNQNTEDFRSLLNTKCS